MENSVKKPPNINVKPLLNAVKPDRVTSNLSGSTFKALIASRLNNSTDWLADKIDKSNTPMNAKWQGPFIYEPPGGDLKKDWFVWLKYQHPKTGNYQRFRYNVGFNELPTKAERRKHGNVVKGILNDMLEIGWHPFQEFNVFEHQRDKTVVTLIDRYLVHCESSVPESLRPGSYKKYRIELRLFQSWLVKKGYQTLNMDEVTKSMFRQFLEENRAERKWSAKTYNGYLNDITTFFNYYHNNYDDIITKVPTKSLSRLRSPKPGNKFWNDWQFKILKERMLERGDQLLYTFCSFIYYAALRNESEAIYIKAGDFNFKNKTLMIDSGTAKNRKTEYIPLYPDFLELLFELKIDQMPGEWYIFGKPENKKNLHSQSFKIGAPYPLGIDFFAARFRPYKDELGIPKKEHGIYRYKHTRAVHLGEDGEDLYKVMRLFRHGDLATTMIYMEGLGVNTQNAEYKKGRAF